MVIWNLLKYFFSTASGREEEIKVAREMFSRRAPSLDSRAKSDDFRAARAQWRDTNGDYLIILATVPDSKAESLSRVACRMAAAVAGRSMMIFL